MKRRVQTLVLGGGVIGAAVADAVARDGGDVLVLDRGRPGHGCSFANAGWVTPSFAMPLARPGLFWTAARWMRDPASPFRVQLRADPELARWLLRFALGMNERSLRRGTRALVELSRFSFEEWRSLAERAAFGFEHRGLLTLALTPEGAEAAARDAALLREFGVAGEVLDAAGVRAREPAVVGPVCGGVYQPGDAHVEPLAATEALMARAEGAGAEVAGGVEAIDFDVRGARIQAVRTSEGWIEADAVVLAAGLWSKRIAARLGLRLPLLGGKGYSFKLPAPDPAPRIPMMVLEHKVAITPYGDRLRIAGTLELVNDDHSVSPLRLDSVARGAARVLDVNPELATGVWAGLRPCTPDGLPIIGRAPGLENLFLATGHQMLGLQTAPATGRLLADLLLGRPPSFDPRPFRAERFR